MAVRVLIADDDASIRRLLRRLIESHDGWSVCGDAQDGQDAIGKAAQLNQRLAGSPGNLAANS